MGLVARCTLSAHLEHLENFFGRDRFTEQESLEDIKEGVPPRELDVELEDDLVGRALPGDRIMVNGVLKFYPRRSQASKSTDFNLFFKSISIENMGAGV